MTLRNAARTALVAASIRTGFFALLYVVGAVLKVQAAGFIGLGLYPEWFMGYGPPYAESLLGFPPGHGFALYATFGVIVFVDTFVFVFLFSLLFFLIASAVCAILRRFGVAGY